METLAHTASWRNSKSIEVFAKAVNHLNRIMKEDNQLQIKIGNQYYGPLLAYARPIKPFTMQEPYGLALRKTITHLAMAVGNKIDVVRRSAKVVIEAMQADGIIRVNFESAYLKKR